jgi:hypothetical protein
VAIPYLQFSIERSYYDLGFAWLLRRVPLDVMRVVGGYLFDAQFVEDYYLFQASRSYFMTRNGLAPVVIRTCIKFDASSVKENQHSSQ